MMMMAHNQNNSFGNLFNGNNNQDNNQNNNNGNGGVMQLDPAGLDSRLANLSLGEIASFLSPKQQEVLLASISVAASFIKQIQEEDEDELHKIRQFAEELKHRRKAIRLSQKGAAQSLRAFTDGVQPCTDAIIYHFENLQLEPDRAMQLIPLLRDWLDWAEKHRMNGRQLPMMSAVTKVPRERKRKVVLFNEKAKQYLEDAFEKNNHPDRYQLDVISAELDIPTRSIRKWFTNRRQRKRFAEKFTPTS